MSDSAHSEYSAYSAHSENSMCSMSNFSFKNIMMDDGCCETEMSAMGYTWSSDLQCPGTCICRSAHQV